MGQIQCPLKSTESLSLPTMGLESRPPERCHVPVNLSKEWEFQVLSTYQYEAQQDSQLCTENNVTKVYFL